MASVFYLALHTSLIVLAYRFPLIINLILAASVIIVSVLWYSRLSFFLFRIRALVSILLTLPIVAFAVLAMNSNIQYVALWVLYVAVIIINYIIPLLKFAIFRLHVYITVKRTVKKHGFQTSISFFKTLFFGKRAPYDFTIKTPTQAIDVAILGTVNASRYIIGETMITSQQFGNGKAYMTEDIDEIERFESDMEYIFPSFGSGFMGTRHRAYLNDISFADKALIIVNPNSYLQAENKAVSMGERSGPYILVSLRTLCSIVSR